MKTFEVLINMTGDPDDWETTGNQVTEEEAIQIAKSHPFGYDYDEEMGIITLFDEHGDDCQQFRSNQDFNGAVDTTKPGPRGWLH